MTPANRVQDSKGRHISEEGCNLLCHTASDCFFALFRVSPCSLPCADALPDPFPSPRRQPLRAYLGAELSHLVQGGAKPVKVQITLTTGILMSGKMSTGVRTITSGISRMMTSAITTNVYGRRSASATIHINGSHLLRSRGLHYG